MFYRIKEGHLNPDSSRRHPRGCTWRGGSRRRSVGYTDGLDLDEEDKEKEGEEDEDDSDFEEVMQDEIDSSHIKVKVCTTSSR